jgi:hypothetical protein
VNTDRPSRANYLVIAILISVTTIIVADRTDLLPWLRPITTRIYLWGVVLGAVAIVLGVVNVGWVHLQRILSGQANWLHSAALVTALLAVLVGGLLNPAGVESPLVDWLFQSIIAPGQATLFALLAFFMAAAAFLFLRAGRTGGGWMLAGALLMLTAQVPVSSVWMPPSVAELATWALDVPGMAALRGALLGGSMAAVVVGVRFLYTTK